MKHSLTLIIAALLLSIVTQASAEEKKTLLILPLEMRGTYRPVEQEQLTELLVTEIGKIAPNLNVTVYSEKTYMMSPEEATRLGKAEGADYVLYGDTQFRKDLKAAKLTGLNAEGYPGGSGVPMGYAGRYMLTVSGVGHGKLVEVASGQLIAERPEILLESEYTGAVEGGAVMEKLEKNLVNRCVHQFSQHLVEKLKEEVKK
jgi:hypothetical protein